MIFMFEGDFTYKDLKLVDDEIGALSNFKSLNKQWCHAYNINKIIDKFKHKISIGWGIECIENLLTKCIKYENKIDKIRSYVKDIMDNKYNLLSEESKKDIDEIYISLTYLKENGINSISIYTIKKLSTDYEKILRILKIQKEIVKKSIKTIDIEDKKKLYIKFLKNESEIYRIYNNLPDKFIKDKKTYISHVSNSMLSDAKEIIAKGIKYKIFSVLNFVVFGALLCIPYFLELRRVPEISIGSIPISLVAVFAIAVFLTLYFCILVFLQNYFLFRCWYESKNKIKYCFIGVDFVAILLMALFPLIYYILNLSYSSHRCLNDIGCLFGRCLGLHAVLLVYFFCKFWWDNKDELSNIFLAAFLIFISDLLILIAIYFNYADEYILIVVSMAILSFLIRLLQISRQFAYRVLLFVLSFMALVFLLFASNSGFFVRVVGLANYQTDFDIKKENIPEYVNLENINKCKNTQDKDINFIKYTCISDEMPSSTVKFKNILVKVKSDGRYWLEVIAKDQNKSKIDDYRFWISEKNIIN